MDNIAWYRNWTWGNAVRGLARSTIVATSLGIGGYIAALSTPPLAVFFVVIGGVTGRNKEKTYLSL